MADNLSYGVLTEGDYDFTDYPVFIEFYLNEAETAYESMGVFTATAQTITITVEADVK